MLATRARSASDDARRTKERHRRDRVRRGAKRRGAERPSEPGELGRFGGGRRPPKDGATCAEPDVSAGEPGTNVRHGALARADAELHAVAAAAALDEDVAVVVA